MSDIVKLGLAWWLAPSLVAGVVWLLAGLLGVTFGLTLSVLLLTGGVCLLVMLATVLSGPICRWFQYVISPVRRRRPRPTAWHQWR